MSAATTGKKVFIKTFGCQMNEYDSDKMADVLRFAQGYEPTTDVESADLILFNTCSVREKAQEKVFSDLGRVKHLKAKGVLIGVGGCVASQEGEAIIARAPYVDVVFGPQTLHRLPELLNQREQQQRPQVDISFPEIEKFDHLPPARVEGASAFVSVMEGCSKYCSYCVVPYTRGEEVSRPFDDVLVEVSGLAAQGVKEVTLLALSFVQQLGQAMQGLRPEHHIDVGRPREDGRTFLARDTTAHADQHPPFLEVLDAAEVAEDLLLCLLAHRTGVEEDQVGLFDIGGRLVALCGVKHIGHLVRVVLVHLAAESFDEHLLAHRYAPVSAGSSVGPQHRRPRSALLSSLMARAGSPPRRRARSTGP